jgi:hypothetical protein
MAKFSTKFNKLLTSKHVCSICLLEENNLKRCDILHEINKGNSKEVVALKDMICVSFGVYVSIP